MWKHLAAEDSSFKSNLEVWKSKNIIRCQSWLQIQVTLATNTGHPYLTLWYFIQSRAGWIAFCWHSAHPSPTPLVVTQWPLLATQLNYWWRNNILWKADFDISVGRGILVLQNVSPFLHSSTPLLGSSKTNLIKTRDLKKIEICYNDVKKLSLISSIKWINLAHLEQGKFKKSLP